VFTFDLGANVALIYFTPASRYLVIRKARITHDNLHPMRDIPSFRI
jgi:hypothetical protein